MSEKKIISRISFTSYVMPLYGGKSHFKENPDITKIREILLSNEVQLPVDNFDKIQMDGAKSSHSYRHVLNYIVRPLNSVLLYRDKGFTDYVRIEQKKAKKRGQDFGLPTGWPEVGLGKSVYGEKKYDKFKKIFDFIKENSEVTNSRAFQIIYEVLNSNVLFRDIFLSIDTGKSDYENKKYNVKQIKDLITRRKRLNF